MASPWSPIIFLKLFFLGDFSFSLKRKSRRKNYFNKYSIKTGIRCSQ